MNEVRRPAILRPALAAAVVAAAIVGQWLLPQLPPFVLLMPAVLLAAFLGGELLGYGALAATIAFALLHSLRVRGAVHGWDIAGIACFAAGGIVAIRIVDLHDRAMARLRQERHRLDAALRAANAATWEVDPAGKLSWDDNFYRLVGLDRRTTPPTTEGFLAMVHPDDREKMAEARRLIDTGKGPRAVDEYRLTRPSGETVWLENHRTRVADEGNYYIGVTQDITRRKQAEERVVTMLREAAHRAKNQFAVIMAVARDTSQGAASPQDFEESFGQRLQALARSNDLLVSGEWKGAGLRDLLFSQLEPFGAGARCAVAGPDIVISPLAAQYLGMAFHELATNAVKHGALSVDDGTIGVSWQARLGEDGEEVTLIWEEHGGPLCAPAPAGGFGTKVLERLVPAALGGRSRIDMAPEGLRWTLTVPLLGLKAGERAG